MGRPRIGVFEHNQCLRPWMISFLLNKGLQFEL